MPVAGVTIRGGKLPSKTKTLSTLRFAAEGALGEAGLEAFKAIPDTIKRHMVVHGPISGPNGAYLEITPAPEAYWIYIIDVKGTSGSSPKRGRALKLRSGDIVFSTGPIEPTHYIERAKDQTQEAAVRLLEAGGMTAARMLQEGL